MNKFDEAEIDKSLPVALRGKKEVLFGNLKEIHSFHSTELMPGLEKSPSSLLTIANVFINLVSAV